MEKNTKTWNYQTTRIVCNRLMPILILFNMIISWRFVWSLYGLLFICHVAVDIQITIWLIDPYSQTTIWILVRYSDLGICPALASFRQWSHNWGLKFWTNNKFYLRPVFKSRPAIQIGQFAHYSNPKYSQYHINKQWWHCRKLQF